MPQDPKTAGVLEEFIATKNANPEIADNVLMSKFPEIQGFANSKGVESNIVIGNLNDYYDKYRSGRFKTLDDLNSDSGFFFDIQETITPPTETGAVDPNAVDPNVIDPNVVDPNLVEPPIEGGVAPVVEPAGEKSVPEMTSDVLEEYIATRNANPDMPDNVLKAKFPEIDAYANIIGADSDVVINDLNNYYDDYRSGQFDTLDELNAKYDFGAGLKKKEDIEGGVVPEENTEELELKIENFLDPQVSDSEVFTSESPEDQNKEVDQIVSGSVDLPLQDGEDEARREDINSKYLELKDAFSLKKEALGDQGKDYFVDNYDALHDEFRKKASDFWESLSPGERRTLIIDQQQVNKDKAIDSYVSKVSKTLNIPEDQIREEMPRMALLMELNDPSGKNTFLVSEFKQSESQESRKVDKNRPGAFVSFVAIRSELANKYVSEIGNNSKTDRFNEILKENGGDEKASQLQFSKEQDDIGFAFTSENDLKIRELKDEIFELENKEFRNPKENLSLKEKRKTLQTLRDEGFVGGGDLFDPRTGEFVSGNTQDEEIIQFNNDVKEKMAKYENTDVGAIRRQRDSFYYQFQAYVNDIMVNQKPTLAPIQWEQLGLSAGESDRYLEKKDEIIDLAIRTYDSGFTGFRDFFFGNVGGTGDDSDAFKLLNSGIWGDDVTGKGNELVAEYMAANRMITLNEDPGTVEDRGFFESVGSGFKEGIGVPSTSTSNLADRSINQLESLGFSITPEQRGKLDKTLTQKVGSAVGNSIPISIEIGLNIAFANKLAGAARIPKLFQAIAGTNKAAKFGLTLAYDAIVQGAAFSVVGEGTAAGVGEGVGQALGSAIMNRFKITNKLLRFASRWGTGAVTETMAEYSGQFLDELSENGYDWEEASEETFGKTPEDAFEKLAVTYLTALTMGVGGSANSSDFLFDIQKELKNSGSDSPIVEAALDHDVTTPITPEEKTQFEEIKKKQESGDSLSDEDIEFSEKIAGKEEFQSAKEVEISPEVSFVEGGESKVKINGDEGFVSDQEIISKLESEEFVNKVKSGETAFEVVNPSEEVEEKISEKFPDYSNEREESNRIAEESVTELEKEDGVTEAETGVEPEEVLPEGFRVVEEGEIIPAGDFETRLSVGGKQTITNAPKKETEVSPEIEGEPKIETDETIEQGETKAEDKAETETKAENILKSEESLNKISEDVSNVAEGIAPFGTKKVFDSTIDFANNVAEETGLKGKELVTEVKTRLEQELGENFDAADIDAISGEITEAVKDVEVKADTEAAEVTPEKKIAEKSKKVADTIRSLKAPIDLGKLSSSPKPLLDAAWNTAVEATAVTIEAGGTVAQAVADGISNIKKSEWYKKLSPEGKTQAESMIEAELTKNIDESQKTSEEAVLEGDFAEGWTSGAKVAKTSNKAEIDSFVEKNKEAIVEDYINNHSKGKEGIIDPDAIREYLHELGYDGMNVSQYVQSGHILTDAIYENLLKTTTNKTIGFLTGVGGSGKSRAVKAGIINTDSKGITFDSAFNWADDLNEYIKKAKDAGFDVELFPVYNDLKTTFENTINRGKGPSGRFLSLDYFLGAFLANNGKIGLVQEANPDIKITPINNIGNNPTLTSVEESIEWNYKPTDQEIADLLKTIENDTELTKDQLTSVAEGIEGVREYVSNWTDEMGQSLKRIKERLQQADGGDQQGEIQEEVSGQPKKPTRKKPRLEKKPKLEPGEIKLNPENKRVAERISLQSTLNEDTKQKIVDKSKNQVRDQKKLLKDTKAVFDSIMSDTKGNWQEVIAVADRTEVDPDIRELMYAHVMQHLSELEQSKDPKVSKSASNHLVDLGIKTAERLNQAGKQVRAMGTIYSNFPMYALYSNLSRLETFANKENNKNQPNRKPGEIKKEASKDVSSVINDIEKNLDQLLKDPKIAKQLNEIKKKLESRSVRPKKLTNKKKKELKDKRAAILKKRFGRGDTLKSGIPGGEQAIGIVELAATFIEEGFYRSQDIVRAVQEVIKPLGAKFTDQQIKEVLKDFDQFEAILEDEKTSIRKDSLGDTISQAVGEYLREGLEFSNLTLKEAIVASDETKERIRTKLIESIKNDFEVSEEQAQSVVRVVDQIFKDKSVELLKKSFDKFYPSISVKKVNQKRAVDKLVDDIALGAFDTTMEFMNMTFQKYGMVNTNNPEIISKLKELSDKMRNAPEGVIKDNRRKQLETFIHEKTNGYGFKDWLMTRFYGSILSGVLTHAKNLKYNTVAIGVIGPLSQIYQKRANPIRTYKEMIRSFMKVDRKVAAHYVRTGDNFIDPGLGPKTFADALQFNLIKNGFTKLLNVASTRFLVASDLIMTRPFASAVFKNHVKAWIREDQGLKGKELEKAALEEMGYTQSNVDKSSKQALEDVKADYGFDPFGEDVTDSVKREAGAMLLMRTQELILENSGVQERMGADNWLDRWNGESLQESSTTEARTLALQGEVMGAVGVVSDLLERLTNYIPAVKFKIPFVRILGNMLNTGIKWTPGLGQIQTTLRYTINNKLASKGMQTTSSATLWALDKFSKKANIPLLKDGVLEGFNKNHSHRSSVRDFRNMFFITGVQTLIYALMAKDDDDEGLVVTGMLDKSFFTRQSIEKGTGISAYGIYWRGADGKLDLISEYKNSAYGFAFSFFGSMSDAVRGEEDDAAKAFLKSWFSSPFYIADKPAATSLKELWDAMSPTDAYGNNKYLDDTGYKDKIEIGVAKFVNSTFVPNLFKQANKTVEQVYGWESKRATNWWQGVVKGIPFAHQIGLETQYDHFGNPIEQKFELGFLGVKGNVEEGFTFLEPEEVDPYYEVYTDHNATPKWFTQKEIPVYGLDRFGKWTKEKIDQPDGGTDTGKMRLSKYEAHIINALIGQYRKEEMDEFRKFSTDESGNPVVTTGIDGLKLLDDNEFVKKISKIDSKAKERAFIDFFQNYYGNDIDISNEEKETSFLKIK